MACHGLVDHCGLRPPDGDMTDYMNSLDLVKAREFHHLWPTHRTAGHPGDALH